MNTISKIAQTIAVLVMWPFMLVREILIMTAAISLAIGSGILDIWTEQ